jgi:hypothetical protein
MSITIEPSVSRPRIRNPYLAGLWPMLGVTGLGVLGFLIAALMVAIGNVDKGALALAALPMALFGGISIIVAALGQRQVRLIRDFLQSGRVCVHWTYTQAEWDALREKNYKESKEYRMLPLGCLAFMLGIAGLMVGAGVVANETSSLDFGLDRLLEIAAGGLLGALAGAVVGALIGGVVVLGNTQTAKQVYRQMEPGQVALSKDEIYALGEYTRADGSSSEVRQVEWERSIPAHMLLTIATWFPRRQEEVWDIMVPERVQAQVEELFPAEGELGGISGE